MKKSPDEICAKPEKIDVSPVPSIMPIYPAAVYECTSTQQAGDLLGGEIEGFVYQRDGHPNATVLGEQCRQLHGGDDLGVAFAQITSTGMSAMALALVAQVQMGDHVLLSDQLYGRTARLVSEELSRFGVEYSEVNMCDLDETARAVQENTRLLIVETIANPLLHVADIEALSQLAHAQNALLLVDNTFATPILTRPFDFGADLVMESMSKILNGHGDVMMGLLCGKADLVDRVIKATSSWGITASPFDCWLASRGLATAHLRVDRACSNALQLSNWLERQPIVQSVFYPGLDSHPTKDQADKILSGGRYSNMISLEFAGGREAVDVFVRQSKKVKFCPSLGEIATTVSHPRSTSHRSMPVEIAEKMGITEGLMRVSCGVESPEFLINEFESIFSAMD